jgi:multiple sugar transport system permease protein
MLILSLKSSPSSFSNFWATISSDYTFKNYTDAFASDNFGLYFLNSLFVSTVVSFGNVLFCFLTAYAIVRKEFSGKKILWLTILGVLIIPPHVVMIPLYRLMVELQWINTYYALIIPWLITPMGIFLVKQYLQSLPVDLENAARIDGAGEWSIIFQIVMPLAKPILTVLLIYIFLSNWNTFLFPFIFTNTEDYRTLPVGLAFYLGKQSIDWGHLMAGAAISALPILLLFVVFQKKIINGLTAGALKE